MKTIDRVLSLISIIFLSFAVTAYAGERTFKVSKGGKLNVSIDAGDIRIITWDRNEIKVAYENDEDDEDELTFEQSGNTIVVESGSSSGNTDLRINIPEQFNCDLRTQSGEIIISGTVQGNVEGSTDGGDIRTDDIIGMLDLSTAGGNITTGNIKGDAELHSSGGDLVLGNIDGKVGLKTAGGNVYVKNVTQSVEVSTGGGNIELKKIDGNVNISTGGGNIDIYSAGGDINITTGGGNMTINGGNGKIKLTTGGGNLDIDNLKGSINATSGGGNITVSMDEVMGKSNLSTGMGDVTLSIPGNAKATIVVNIGSSWITDMDEIMKNVFSDFPLKSSKRNGEHDMLTLTYEVNGGGSTINISTSEGSVHLKKNK
ncbi:MAG TPA: DUF4097 family beta strand repeat-containing protein [Ignavibacteriaceae bacterium]|nr:DUF4097 family beta strand repeat-containing protein [Ignavibacteriaceae bacterium]